MPIETVHLAEEGKKEEFQPTAEELRSIQSKMKDPKFVELMHEYMQSLQDPETRREEEAYLAQAEREAKEGGDFSFEFVFPTPSFVVELANPTTRRIAAAEVRKLLGSGTSAAAHGVKDALTFLNMCSSEKVERHTEERVGSSRDSNWHVPVSVSAKRIEVLPTSLESGMVTASQKEGGGGEGSRAVPAGATGETGQVGGTGRLCYVHDAVFNPTTLSLADRSDKFLCFLVEIAVEQINAGYKESNGFEFRRLPSSVKSIGVPKNQTVRRKKGSGPSSPFDQASNSSHHDPAADPVLTRPTKHLYPESARGRDDGDRHTPSTDVREKKKKQVAPASRLPPHSITHRGSIDMTDAWQWKVSEKRVGVPEQLVVKLTFAAGCKAADLDVSITDDGTAVSIATTPQQQQYDGLLILPFTVEATPVKAALEKGSGTLTLVLRVTPPQPRAEEVAVVKEVKERFIGSAIAPLAAETKKRPEEREAASLGEATAAAAAAPTAAPAVLEESREEEGEAGRTGEQTTGESQVPVAIPPPPTAAAFTSNEDRARLMMEKVMEARKAREAAAAAAAATSAEAPQKETEDDSAIPGIAEATDATPQEPSHETATTAAAAATTTTATTTPAPPVDAEASEPKEVAEEVPFLQKRDLAREAEEAELRARQEAWSSMVREQMERLNAKEEAEAAEADRLAEKERAKAAKKLAAAKEAEAAERRVETKMAAVPVCNKYIFAID